eukprot:13278681-Alexandrium_andersonii.AAC.1
MCIRDRRPTSIPTFSSADRGSAREIWRRMHHSGAPGTGFEVGPGATQFMLRAPEATLCCPHGWLVCRE